VALSIPAMKYQIVIQWPASSIADYDRMIEVESALIDSLSEGSEVDGHDAGSGEMNTFVYTDNVQDAFVEIKGLLAARAALNSARVAYREIGKNELYDTVAGASQALLGCLKRRGVSDRPSCCLRSCASL